MSKAHRLMIHVTALQMKKAQQQNNIIAIRICDQACKIGHICTHKLSYFLTVAYPNFSSDKDVLLKVYAMLIN